MDAVKKLNIAESISTIKNLSEIGRCAVQFCKSRSDTRNEKGSFTKFYEVQSLKTDGPLHSRRRCEKRWALWLQRIGRMDVMFDKTRLRVCELHFISGKFSCSKVRQVRLGFTHVS